MKADERRKQIINTLMAERQPVSGSALSEKLHASRQIIVQDIAVLRASGFEILSTHQGYIIKSSPLRERDSRRAVSHRHAWRNCGRCLCVAQGLRKNRGSAQHLLPAQHR